ncbi:MAG: SPW repeat protein [Limnochordia bacterium]|jgi:hypothetical protein|nr:SPW repeat protein [Bacillota bacterium]HQD39824.1 SPW repeat protein [Bacillota bacterium]
MWQKWVNGILGLWVIISPFVISGTALLWSNVVSGIVIAVLSLAASSSQSSCKEASKEA